MVGRPAFNYARDAHTLKVSCQGALFRSESQSLALGASVPLEEDGLGEAQACFTFSAGQRVYFLLESIPNDDERELEILTDAAYEDVLPCWLIYRGDRSHG